MLSRFIVILLALLGSSLAFAQAPRYLVTPDGTLHLALEGAPGLTLPPNAKPAEPDNEKWKAAIAKGGTYEDVVSRLRKGEKVEGFKQAFASVTLGVFQKGEKAILVASRPKPSLTLATFQKDANEAWSSGEGGKLSEELKGAVGAENPVDAFAKELGSVAQGTAWTRLVEGARSVKAPKVLWNVGGKVAVVQPLTPRQFSGIVNLAPAAVASTPPKKVDPAKEKDEPKAGASPILFLLLGAVVAAMPLGYMIWRSRNPAMGSQTVSTHRDEEFRQLAGPILEAAGARAMRTVSKENPSRKESLSWSLGQLRDALRSPGASNGKENWVQQASGGVLREYGLNGQSPAEVKGLMRVGEAAVSACATDRSVTADKLTQTEITNWLGTLARDNAKARSEAEKAKGIAAEGERMKRDAEGFLREKAALVQQLEAERTRGAKLDAANAAAVDADKKREESMQQLDRVRQRLQALNELMKHLRDGQRSIQHRINDPEVFSIIGYLVNYSMANLLSPESEQKPGLQKAMLENLWNISRCFEDSSAGFKQAVKMLQAQAPWLASGSAAEASPEPHDERSHFQLLLENAKYRKQIQIPVFHIDVDRQGRPQSARPA